MANKTALECTDQLLRFLTGYNDRPFGNKTFVGLGDFRQVAPVVRGGGPSTVLSSSIKSSYLWQYFISFQLTQPIRDFQDSEYSKWIDSIGEGNPSHTITEFNMDHLLQFSTFDEAIQFLFPQEVLTHPDIAIYRSYLSPYNIAVDEFNSRIINEIDADKCIS